MEYMEGKARKLKVGFIGNVNAMPMMFALKFKEMGMDVKYIVDSNVNETQHRPEYQFENISYPYPEWIKEHILSPVKQYLIPIFPNFILGKVIKEMSDRDVIFFNNYGFQISGFFKKNVIKIALFSGSDLSDMADMSYPHHVLHMTGIKKYIYFFMRYMLVRNQRKGIRNCHILSYFPKGISRKDDELICQIMKDINYMDVRRYGSTNFQSLNLSYAGVNNKKIIDILVPVRFNFGTSFNSEENKGNDLIIKAVNEVYKNYKNIRVHFFSKGDRKDIDLAKQMCKQFGLDAIVKWHKEVPLRELITLYKECDLVIDQVGSHWPGAITFIGLHMGKPVITNLRRDICEHYWGEKCPVLTANTVESIQLYIEKCLSYDYREEIGKQSYIFAQKYINADYYVEKCMSAISHVLTNYRDYKR